MNCVFVVLKFFLFNWFVRLVVIGVVYPGNHDSLERCEAATRAGDGGSNVYQLENFQTFSLHYGAIGLFHTEKSLISLTQTTSLCTMVI